MLRYQKEELIGMKMFDLFPDVDRSMTEQLWADFLKQKKQTGQIKLIRKDGQIITAEYCAVCDILPGNHLSILSDITENENNITLLKNSEQALARANADKDKLFAIIAHDLRNPIFSYASLASYIEEKSGSMSPDEIKEIFGQIKNSAYGLKNLLDQLLDWALASSRSYQLVPERINASVMIENCMNHSLSAINYKHVTIENRVDPVSTLSGDRILLETVFRNLMINAIKYSHQNGQIVIQSNINRNGFIEISVEDHGEGIDESILPSLFKPEFVKSIQGTKGENGNGFGLLLCREIVERHGGSIRAESEAGKGSRFIVQLPGNGRTGKLT
jgi:signal transduction histidine kinase